MQPGAIGFITYSEGCNDDVNKMIWSGLGWELEQKVADILREYSRYFIGDRFTETFAEGLLALENDWRGPLLANEGVEKTLAHFRALEKEALPADLRNWRFQQALFRAYYDASVRERLIAETQIEGQAMNTLRRLMDQGTLDAMSQAEQQLKAQAVSSNDTRILSGRGLVSDDWDAIERRKVQGRGGGSRGQPGHAGLSAEQPGLVAGALREDSPIGIGK